MIVINIPFVVIGAIIIGLLCIFLQDVFPMESYNYSFNIEAIKDSEERVYYVSGEIDKEMSLAIDNVIRYELVVPDGEGVNYGKDKIRNAPYKQ